MHEYGLAERILESAIKVSTEHDGCAVAEISVCLSQFSNVVPQALESAFNLLKQGTTASGAELIALPSTPELRCRECGRGFQATEGQWECPECHSTHVRTSTGDELKIVSITLESPRNCANA